MSREMALQLVGMTALATTLVSFVFSYISRRLALKADAVDRPDGGRKIHQDPVPLWGGLGIALTILGMSAAFIQVDQFFGRSLHMTQIMGYAVGVLILAIGGMIDDRWSLPPRIQVIFPILAALAVIFGGTGIIQVTDPSSAGALSLVWWRIDLGSLHLSLPSDIVTFVWLLVATYATKILDGLDGLVTGLVVIGAGLVSSLSLSPNYFQPAVAVFSAAAGGAFLGFLPRNTQLRAKQFLGEAGSTIAGFTLGVLAILSSAKVAMALAVLAIPISDIALVVIGRIWRGAPPFQGDDTHLHFRLLQAGLSQRKAVLLYWGIAFTAGIMALGLQTKGKVFLVISLVTLTIIASIVSGWVARKRRYAKN